MTCTSWEGRLERGEGRGREGKGEGIRDLSISCEHLFLIVLHNTHTTELVRLDDPDTGDVYHLC